MKANKFWGKYAWWFSKIMTQLEKEIVIKMS